MRADKKRHDNKYNFDAGRLRTPVEFKRITYTTDSYGGAVTQETTALSTMGALEQVSINSLSQMAQLGVIGGASELEQYRYLIIRKYLGNGAFYPTKDMVVYAGGQKYVINGVMAMDVPETFTRLLCALSE